MECEGGGREAGREVMPRVRKLRQEHRRKKNSFWPDCMSKLLIVYIH